MTPIKHEEIYDLVCKPGFETLGLRLESIEGKIDIIDEKLENYNLRIDRLEQKATFQAKMMWIVVTCVIGSVVNQLFDLTGKFHSNEDRSVKTKVVSPVKVETTETMCVYKNLPF